MPTQPLSISAARSLVSILILGSALTGALGVAACGSGDPALAQDGGSGNGSAAAAGAAQADEQKGEDPKEGGEEEKPRAVRTHRLAPEAVVQRLPCTGHIEAFHAVGVLARATGKVLEVLVEEGDRVERDAVLIRIESIDAELALEAAKIDEAEAQNAVEEAVLLLAETDKDLEQKRLDLAQAERDLARAKEGLSEGIKSPQDLENAQLLRDRASHAFFLARSSRDKAKLGEKKAKTRQQASVVRRRIEERNVSHYTVKAPIAGVVDDLSVRGGEWVLQGKEGTGQGSSLCRIADTDRLVVRLRRPQEELARLATGMKVELESDVFEGKSFAGEVELLAPSIDPTTGNFELRVRVADAEGLLRPGMFCRAWIVTGQSREALMIPKQALVYEADRPMVFVVRGDRAQRIPIEPGIETKDALEATNRVALLADVDATRVAPGDEIIVTGQKNLGEGARVRIAKDEPESGNGDEAEASGAKEAAAKDGAGGLD